ncbi:MAG: hypothetical protein SWE60_04460, partial [Thermodesulfobacteriota bacterium]|nr:hypothetical protein [Thermodesulfobacteriota bacterium]
MERQGPSALPFSLIPFTLVPFISRRLQMATARPLRNALKNPSLCDILYPLKKQGLLHMHIWIMA